MSLEKYTDLLVSSSLYFCRTDKFIDRYEGTANKYTYELIENYFYEFDNAKEMQQSLKGIIESIKTVTFVNCWHMSIEESMAMWETYSPNGEGVAIKTTFMNLRESIQDMGLGPIFFSPVRYAERLEENIDLRNFASMLCYKRPQFKFENEFRVFLTYTKGITDEYDKDKINIVPPDFGQKIKINLSNLIEEVYVHPNCSDKFYNLVSKITNEHIEVPVLRSKF